MNETLSIGDLLVILFSTAGVVFMLVSSIGILRLPDVLSRMHAAGKASTVGVTFVLLAAGIFFGEPALLLRMIALIAFIFITAPVATTAMARAAYRTGATRSVHLKYDEMAGTVETETAPVQAAARPAGDAPTP